MPTINRKWFEKNLKMEAKRYGCVDLKKFEEILEQIPTDIVFETCGEEAARVADMVRKEIDAQPFWWQPLNEAYKEQKDRAGLNTDMLKATEEYSESIGIQESQRGKKKFRIRVGVPNRRHETSDINLNDLGAIHEYGTERIPRRPHWDRDWETLPWP